MAVGPDRLEAVAAHPIQPGEGKGIVRVRAGRSPVDIAKDVLFPGAGGTGAEAPDGFDGNERLVAVRPANRQFTVKRSDIQGLHEGKAGG